MLSKQNCVTTSTRVSVRRPQSRHAAKPFQRVRQFEKRMAFGMTGHADGRDAVRLDQSAGADIARRFERALGRRDIARDQENARNVGLAPRPRQEIIERFPRGISRAAICGTGLKPARRNAVAVSTLWR